MPRKRFSPPEFLVDLLNARSPSGYESEAQAVVDRHVEPVAHRYERDSIGNRIARPHSKSLSSGRFKVLRHGRTSLWLAGFGF